MLKCSLTDKKTNKLTLTNNRMIKSKKGISPVIGWILMVGLTITLAGVVTVWMKSTATYTAEKMTTTVGTDIQCSDVSINAYEYGGQINCDIINLINRGYFTIESVKLRALGDVQDIFFPDPLNPSENITLNPGENISINLNIQNIPSNKKIGLVPIVMIEESMMACMTKEIAVQCT